MDKRVIKFRALVDLNKFKVIIDEIAIHTASEMVGCTLEQFEEALESTDWKLNEYWLVNKKSGDTLDCADIGCHDSGEDYFFFSNYELIQYSGLKDNFGEEIYEDDIVVGTREWDKDYIKYQVVFSAGMFCLDRPGDSPSFGAKQGTLWSRMNLDKIVQLKVIGNIHKNPELLK